MVEIEKNVPMPRGTTSGNLKYPWPDMEVGDSILLADATTNSGAYSSAMAWAARHGKAFKSRTVPEGLRIWRTA